MEIFGRSPGERAATEARRRKGRSERAAKEQAKKHEQAERAAAIGQSMAAAAEARYSRANQIAEKYETEYRHYANLIILLGYGGFFALWSSLAGKMPRTSFGVAGLLMGISLLIFLLFEITRIGIGSWAMNRAQRINLDEYQVLGYLSSQVNKIDRWWLFAFIPSLLLGLCSGAIVLWAFWCNAMQIGWA